MSISNMDIANSTITAGKNMCRDNVKLFLNVKKKSAISGTPKCAKGFLIKSFVSLAQNVPMCTWSTQAHMLRASSTT